MKKLLCVVGIFLITSLSAQVNIAVMDFEGKNVSQADASALTDRLRAELFLTGKFVVLEREKMDAILKEQAFQLSGCTSDACIVEAGQFLAVEQMVSGSVSKIGQTYSVTARLISVEKGNLLSVGKCDLKGDIGDLMNCLSDVSAQLSGKQPVPRNEPIPIQTTKSTNTAELPEMVFVKGGTFQMGSNNSYDNAQPIHTITISDFWINKFEITQKVWNENSEYNPSFFKGDDLPVETVCWHEVVDFCNRKSQREGLKSCYLVNGKNIECVWDANGYRLPTEAEWEYAARGGTQSSDYYYSGGDNVNMVAWYLKNSDYKSHPVGNKKANELGVFDMSGNILEWCWDYYSDNYYRNSQSINPRGPDSTIYRVCRGGSWYSYPDNGHCTGRYYLNPKDRCPYVGFRLVRTN